MMFFGLMTIVALVAALAGRAGVPGLADWRASMRWGMAVALVLVGTDHLVTPERYLPMMPSLVPFPHEVILLTGLAEIAGGIGLLVPRLRWLAGLMLGIYFVSVFPANIKVAVYGMSVAGMPEAGWYYWVRLAFQPLAVWWALYASGAVSWPVRRQAAGRAPSWRGSS